MSNKPSVGGKQHISKKPLGPSLNIPEFMRNDFQVAPEILKDIESKGQECRWINAKQYIDNDNSHKKGWTVYKRPPELQTAQGHVLGNSVDGTVRRRDLVLAVRPKEWGDQHRALIELEKEKLRRLKKSSSEGYGIRHFNDSGDEE